MRNRIDIGEIEKVIIEDLVERGYFKDSQSVIMGALSVLQAKLAEDTYTDEYNDDKYQQYITDVQLYQES